jgi:hypothetical protein
VKNRGIECSQIEVVTGSERLNPLWTAIYRQHATALIDHMASD